MHTLNRILTILLLLVVLVPPATFALVSLEAKDTAKQELQHVLNSAVRTYQQRTGLQNLKTKGERIIREQQTKIQSLEKRKRELRLAVRREREILAFVAEKYHVKLSSKETIQQLVSKEKRRMARLLKRRYLERTVAGDKQQNMVQSLFFVASAENNMQVLTGKQEKFLRDLVAAEKAFWRLETFTKQRDGALAQYWDSQHQYQNAELLVEHSEEQMEEIKSIMEEVHAQVLRMQGELARIDARLKEKAERELIKKGLMDPKNGTSTSGTVFKPQFSWPVYGRPSAGFMNPDYKKHFGVPHYGLDIVVGQETPVASAAEGVVFLVRDGGTKGYSYILIGHRGGYATLYGHISKALVIAEQEVNAGDIIALSGGTPGTHGAGPMTTGAHVHFEVIKAGVNIDPKGVLP